MGTRLWYGFYGAVVSEEGQFEGKVSELCRELGDRGRASELMVAAADGAGCGSAAAAGSNAGDGSGDSDPALVALVSELRVLRAGQLRKRAVAAGVSAEALDEAEKADDVKAALTALVVGKHREMGASGRMVAVLEVGGEDAVELIESVLEHAMEVLETVSVATPRKGRKLLRAVLDRAESVLESTVDAEWADGVAQCSREQLELLGSALVGVEALVSAEGSGAGDAAMATVSELLGCLARCGSAVLRSMAVLSDGASGQSGTEASAVLGALETLRGMGRESL
eukprot:SAG11_NODE_10187_length_848_cov_16.106809_1_plen_282_part_11